jgi:hypothetical protein
MTHEVLPFRWVRDYGARWYRATGVTRFPIPRSVSTLCGMILDEIRETRGDPPVKMDDRCHACELEGEPAPPNL